MNTGHLDAPVLRGIERDLEVERRFLTYLFADPVRVHDVAAELDLIGADFVDPIHSDVYACLMSLAEDIHSRGFDWRGDDEDLAFVRRVCGRAGIVFADSNYPSDLEQILHCECGYVGPEICGHMIKRAARLRERIQLWSRRLQMLCQAYGYGDDAIPDPAGATKTRPAGPAVVVPDAIRRRLQKGGRRG